MNDDHPYDAEIASISIEGFKSIEGIRDPSLRPINVLIGVNGSGKSNFIDVFSLLQAVRDEAVDVYIHRSGGVNRILHFGSKVTPKLKVAITCCGKSVVRIGPGGSRR